MARPSRRVRLAGVLVVGVVAVAVAGVVGSAGNERGTAGPSAAALAVAPEGSDAGCRRGSLSTPCASFAHAYQLARCGDTVEVRPGSYPDQDVVDSSPRKSCAQGTYVVFRPTRRGTVVLDRLNFGSGEGDGGDWVEVRDIAVRTRVEALHGSSHLRLLGIDGGSFYLSGTSHVLLSGNDWGPCASSGDPDCRGQNFIDANYGSRFPTSDVVIDGDVFHDFTIADGSGDHFECLFVTGANGPVTIRNSRFDRCETYGIFFQARLPSHGFQDASFLVEGNWFGETCCFEDAPRNSAVTFASVLEPRNVLIRFNTFAPGQDVVSEGGVQPANVRVVGNVLGGRFCVGGIGYRGNLRTSGRCSDEDRTAAYGYRFDGRRLLLDEPRALAVRRAYAAAAEGTRLSAIALSLRRDRRPPPAGGWNARTVGALLGDDVYLGRRLGRPGQHAPLVSAKRWRAAQRVLAPRAPNAAAASTR